MITKLIKAVSIAGLLAISCIANAGIIYTYTGNTFTSASGALTGGDRVTAILALDNRLSAGSSSVDISLLDGYHLTLASGGISINSDEAFVNSDVSITTDAIGNITNWNLRFGRYRPGSIQIDTTIGTQYGFLGADADFATDFAPFGVNIALGEVYTTGSWTSVNIAEPSMLAIFAFGLLGLASHRFKKQS